MKGVILLCAALGLLAVMAFPFAHDAYTRHRVMSKLNPILSDQDRTAFQGWQGDAVSFARSLYARCELDHGRGATACSPYQVALE
jgi:hypothetical protein